MLGDFSDSSGIAHRSTLVIPIQPRNSTIRCFLLYRVNMCMLPFAMRSAPIPAGVVGSASRAAITSRAPWFSSTTSVPTRMLDRFVDPLFSYCYELLFPQLLCFANHLRCPLVFGSKPSPSPHAATWTRRAHPTIITVSSRFQVHG